MNKKLLLALSSALVTGAASLFGQALPAPAPAATWTVTPAFASQYMFRGVRMGGPGFQPTIEYSQGRFAGGVWGNIPLDNTVPGVSDPEFDIYGSYTMPLSENMSMVGGFTWYLFPDAVKNLGFYKSTFEPSVALNYTVNGLKLTPKLYYDVVLKGVTAEFTAFYAIPLQDMGTELDLTAVAGTFKWDEAAENTSPSVKNWGDYWSLGVSMPFQVSANSKVTIGAAYVEGSNNYFKQASLPRTVNTGAISRGVFSIAYSVTF